MGRMDVNIMRYLETEHFRVLIAVEMGMKNHEIVPLPLISAIAGIHRGATSRSLSDLSKHRLVAFERSKKFDGYRLTVLGYDYLALKALCTRDVVCSVGNQIGVGKESDVYVGGDAQLADLCLKFHRLGRTSFRKIKEKRDYHNKRKSASWLYLSRLAAAKEFAFLKALHDRGFPVPRPVDVCRHLVVMGLIDGKTLCHVDEISDPGALYDRLMALIVKLARHGLIHGDFNEFNLMLYDDERVIMIDFPQMVSTDHPNAEYYFDRDVQCVRTFFKRKFDFDSDDFPKFSEIERKYNMDVELEASGFSKQMALDLNKAYDEGNYLAHCEADVVDENENDSLSSVDDDNESTSSAEDSNGERIEEEPDDVDEEELRQEEENRKQKSKILAKSERFNAWLTSTAEELEKVVIDEKLTSEGALKEHPREVEREAELRRDREEYIRAREIADAEDARRADEAGEDELAHEVPESAEDQAVAGARVRKVKKSNGAHSIVSTSSTIPPEEIKRRVALEKMRDKQKTKLRVKGKQSAVRRGRKENRCTIAEYADWL